MMPTSFLGPFARATTRLVAGVSALLLAAAGLTVLTATAAHAEESSSNGHVTLTVEVSPVLSRYTTDTELTFTVSVAADPDNTMDCDEIKPTLSWADGITPDASGQVVGSTLTRSVGKKAAGDYQFSGAVFPGGCNDLGQISVPLRLYIYPATMTATGSALRGNVPASSSSDYTTVEGVTVDLLAASDGPDATPVDSTLTLPDGSYSLTAPTATQEEADREYKIRFTYPDSTVVYYDGTPNAWLPSTSDWDEATATTAGTWSPTYPLSALVTSAPPPSQTNQDRFCDNSESEYTDFSTNTVEWDDICETDPSVYDAETRGANDHDDALDSFGYIWFKQSTGSYSVTADSFETNMTDGVLTTVLHDDDIFLPEADRTVDVTVTRTFAGSFARWIVEVRDAGTDEIVDVPFSFGGELGSDQNTVWTGSGAWRVSDDDRYLPTYDGDPILAHHVTASSFDWDTNEDYSELEVRGGQLTYILALVDYTDCISSSTRAAASTIAQAIPGNFGTDLTTLAGDPCVSRWVPAPVFGELQVGVPFDQTFPVNSPLDWSLGGDSWVDDLPPGLDVEVLNAGIPDTSPQLRIHGTPRAEGTYSLLFMAWGRQSAPHNEDAVSVPITVLPADGPSTTNASRLCDEGYSTSLSRDFTTASVLWEDACETDPSIDEAETIAHHRGDAFDGFGYVIFDQGPLLGADPYLYYVTADSYTSSVADGALTTVIQDDDIVLPDDSSVDVTVTRTIKGSFTRWAVEVRDSDTGAVADVPFTFGGNLGSDDDTVWSGSGNWRTSDDGGYGDPVLAHYATGATGGSIEWVDDEGDSLDDGDGYSLVEVDGGLLTYVLAAIDYGLCDEDTVRDAAAEIAQAMPGNFGQDLSSIAGDCNAGWPVPAMNEMRVGTLFDQTITVESTALDWEHGGAAYLDGLPAGLDWESLHVWEDDIAPQVHIFGTPTAVGPFSISFQAWDDLGDDDAIELTGTVLGPVQSSDIHLNFGIGDQVGGGTADVTGTGLKAGSDFTVIVESTPQTIGSGTIGSNLLLNSTVTFPTNLGAGWHSVTLAGTFFDGTALTNVLWIQLAADGTLLAVSTTAPAAGGPGTGLAGTGVEAAGGLVLALSLLLLGGLVVVAWRRRRTIVTVD